MAGTTTRKTLSVCATTGSHLPDISIKDGQLIFVQDLHRIAFDFNGKRVFYNQIEELESEQERRTLASPESGQFYFVIETAVLWTYRDGWIALTSSPEEVVFIGTEMPELGVPKKLYVNKASKEISVWDESNDDYLVVADKSEINTITNEDIESLFK